MMGEMSEEDMGMRGMIPKTNYFFPSASLMKGGQKGDPNESTQSK